MIRKTDFGNCYKSIKKKNNKKTKVWYIEYSKQFVRDIIKEIEQNHRCSFCLASL